MAAYLTNTEELTLIAEAIRYKGEVTNTFIYPQGFVDAIINLATGTEIIATNMLNNLFSGSCYFPEASFIGSFAFANCYRITGVDLPNATAVYESAFYRATSIQYINLPMCSYIGDYAFGDAYYLTEINLPECTVIGEGAFEYCYRLSTVSLPKCTHVSSRTFQNCSKLEYISLPLCEDFFTFGTFLACSALSYAYLPKAKELDNYTFMNCSNLISITLSECSLIDTLAVHDCPNLESLYLLGSSVTSCYSHWHTDKNYNGVFTTKVYVPASLVSAYKSHPQWKYHSSLIFALN